MSTTFDPDEEFQIGDDTTDRANDLITMQHRLDEVVKSTMVNDDNALMDVVQRERYRRGASDRKNVFANQTLAMKQNKRDFERLTRSLNTSNEAYNSNHYILQNVANEKKRVARLADVARNELQMSHQQYLRENYKLQLLIFMSNITLYTIIGISVTFMLMRLSKEITLFLSIVLSLSLATLYAMALFFEFWRHSLRLNPYHWNRLYFPAGDDFDKDKGDDDDIKTVDECASVE